MLSHQEIGGRQNLWFADDLAPGAPFFLPAGCHIYNKLVELMRNECWKEGYQEVMSPQMLNAKIFDMSGHLAHYADDMFLWEHDGGQRVGLKPMSCPCHCIMFGRKAYSYRELPIRLSEFGVVHRNECRGSLSGLRRVVRFCQDDAHIFCSEEQVAAEVLGVLKLQRRVYEKLGLKASFELASRPAKALGDGNDGLWLLAERALRAALHEFAGDEWSLDEGGGAFYGPKIDCKVEASGRWLQCASVQLDFQMPRRFGLRYVDAGGQRRAPVLIHRAVLGSIERMMAVLAERCQGRWPFWLSPRQVLIVPVHAGDEGQRAAVAKAHAALRNDGFAVELDLSDADLRYKIKESQQRCFNYVAVIGSREAAAGAVSLRALGEKRSRNVPLAELRALFAQMASLDC